MDRAGGHRFRLWLYRVLLRAYPPAFLRRYGEEMTRLFAARLDEVRDRAPATLALLVGGVWDAIANGIAERIREARLTRRGPDAPAGCTSVQPGRRRDLMGGLRMDIGYGLRLFPRSPVFAAIAVITIALGIGANTAVFSVVRAVLLRPLPYDDPDRLVLVQGELVNRDVQYWPTSPPDLIDYRARATGFSQLEGVFTFSEAITGDEREPEQLEVAGVTPGFLRMLGARPVLGRLFTEEDAAPAAEDTPPGEGPPGMIILSHELWQRRFGGDPEVVGRSLELGGGVTVVGVLEPGVALYMPPPAGLSSEIDVWFAPRFNPATWNRSNVVLRMVGRLADGAAIAQVQQQIDAAVDGIRELNPRAESAGLRQHVVPVHDELTREVRPIVLALLGAVGFVLLIACANVSNLLLVRASMRQREMAVRAALGGSRAGLARLVLTESLVLALAGGLLGLALAYGGIRLLLALQPPDMPRLGTVSIDGVVLAYTALAATAAALVFGLMPAVQAMRSDVAHLLKDRGASAGGRAQGRLRAAVVVLEVALSLVLLIGAGLMVRSFLALRDVDPGYDAERVLTFGVQLPGRRYGSPEERLQFITRFRERLAALPGATAAAAATPLPLSGSTANGPYGTEAVLANPDLFQQAELRVITEGYFETMGTRILEGRAFTDADRSASAPNSGPPRQTPSTGFVVVDRTLAQKMWPRESAVGKRLMIRFGSPDYVPVHVIGVVEHQRSGTLAAEGRETIYYHDAYAGPPGNMTWVVRSDGDPAALVSGTRAALAEIDPLLPMVDVRTMSDYTSVAMGPTRFALALIGFFGATALVLAAVGLYGVLAHAVRQRTPEIGIRMAFGAERGAILRMVVGQGLRLAAIGVVAGSLAALGLTRVLASQLVAVEPTDPATFFTVAATFVSIAFLASYIPARRATRVDPLVALRSE